MVKKQKKRFIAGAKCPQCEGHDTLYVSEKNAIQVVSCVDCSYQDKHKENKDTEHNSEHIIGIFKPESHD
tara:strand:- start:1386 stop:1595 length:210 start_codon:yes stop_codon:yes gene_type:complete